MSFTIPLGVIPRHEFEAYSSRLERALKRAGLSAGQFSRLLEQHPSGDFRTHPDVDVRLPYSFVKRCLSAQTMPYDGARVIFADILDCDVRWLATGKVSEAALAWIRALPPAGDEEDAAPLVRMLEATAQEPGDEEVCRYCGVTREELPEGSEWIDYLHTICSACLEVPRE